MLRKGLPFIIKPLNSDTNKPIKKVLHTNPNEEELLMNNFSDKIFISETLFTNFSESSNDSNLSIIDMINLDYGITNPNFKNTYILFFQLIMSDLPKHLNDLHKLTELCYKKGLNYLLNFSNSTKI